MPATVSIFSTYVLAGRQSQSFTCKLNAIPFHLLKGTIPPILFLCFLQHRCFPLSWFILLNIQTCCNSSCLKRASLYPLPLLDFVSCLSYALKPSSLKESSIFSVSSFSHRIPKLTPENCSYTISPKLLSSKSSADSMLLKTTVNSHFSPSLTFQQHLPQLITLSSLMQVPHLAYNTTHLAGFSSTFLVPSSQCFCWITLSSWPLNVRVLQVSVLDSLLYLYSLARWSPISWFWIPPIFWWFPHLYHLSQCLTSTLDNH